ncbi:TPA: hypothetical protein NJY80_000011 [Vibrio parahaemolyticus]|nr:hypothetical protein [Vibrio parahaemolyticus]
MIRPTKGKLGTNSTITPEMINNALEFKSRFERTALGLMCLECGANSVDVNTRQDGEDSYVEEFSCRFCGYGEDHHHDID